MYSERKTAKLAQDKLAELMAELPDATPQEHGIAARAHALLEDLRRAPYRLPRRYLDGTYCHECGGHMFIDSDGVAHHGKPDAISDKDDADHVAIVEGEDS